MSFSKFVYLKLLNSLQALINQIKMRDFTLFRGHSAMGKSYQFNPFKINAFKTHSLKIFNFAQQNLTKLLCRNCADNIKSIYRIRSYICLFSVRY